MTPPPAATPPPLAPPSWPRASTPLRIAFLGWARLSLQAREGSGYNLSASELAAGLALSGHRIAYLASGMHYTLRPWPFITQVETWRAIDCFALHNSPNLSPAASNFRNTRQEMSSPAQSRLVVSWLDRLGIQIVHIHSLEGYGLDLIPAIRASGRPVVVTPHNYWYVCPQVDLLHEEVRVCTDYDGGRRCAGCLPAPHPAGARLRRRLGQTLDRAVGPFWTDAIRPAAKAALVRVRSLFLPSPTQAADPATEQSAAPPDPELSLGFNISDAPTHDGAIEHNLLGPRAEPVRLGSAPLDQNERFLRADHHLTVLNDYGRRRHAGIAALNHASLVTPPSDFLRRVHVTMGLREQRTRVVRLGQPHFDQIGRRARRSPFYDARPWDPRTATRPLRFAFWGTVRHNKGLDVLIRAIPLLAKEVRQRAQFLIRASGPDWAFRLRAARYPEVQFAGAYDLMQLVAGAGEYDAGLLPHIWFENSPLVLLEHLHAGKFVVASRLGGPPEWIVPGRNGLLFPAGEPGDLAACITRLVTGEVPIPSPREVHEITPHLQSYPGHVAEVADIYTELLACDQGDPSGPSPSRLARASR